MIRPRLASWLLAGMLAAGPALAQTTGPATEPVNVLDTALLQAMRAGNAAESFQARCNALRPAVERAFNLPAILQKVVGLRWASMDAAQQHTLLEAFTRFTVASYVANFSRFGGEQLTVVGSHKLDVQEVVETELTDPNGGKVKMNYVVGAVNGYWQIVDVLLDGSISRAAVMRSDFRVLLSQGGTAALIKHLDQKTNDLARGQR